MCAKVGRRYVLIVHFVNGENGILSILYVLLECEFTTSSTQDIATCGG